MLLFEAAQLLQDMAELKFYSKRTTRSGISRRQNAADQGAGRPPVQLINCTITFTLTQARERQSYHGKNEALRRNRSVAPTVKVIRLGFLLLYRGKEKFKRCWSGKTLP